VVRTSFLQPPSFGFTGLTAAGVQNTWKLEVRALNECSEGIRACFGPPGEIDEWVLRQLFLRRRIVRPKPVGGNSSSTFDEKDESDWRAWIRERISVRGRLGLGHDV